MPITNEELQQFVGWQLRITDPSDEGTYYQGHVAAIQVTEKPGFLPHLGVEMSWMAKRNGEGAWFSSLDERIEATYGAPLEPSARLEWSKEGCPFIVLAENEHVLSFLRDEGEEQWLDPDSLPWLQEAPSN